MGVGDALCFFPAVTATTTATIAATASSPPPAANQVRRLPCRGGGSLG
jgi:hypothetical protein